MKRFLLLLAAACVSFVSCSEDSSDPYTVPSMLEELQKRFDFSEVNTDGLEIKKVYEFHDNEDNGRSTSNTITFVATHPDIVVIVGEIDKCLWLGLFDRESGKLKYQYTDVEHPVSYSVYGVNYEYGVGDIYGIYFEDNVIIAIQYPKQDSKEARLDLLSFDGGKTYRTIISDNSNYSSKLNLISQWTRDTVVFQFTTFLSSYNYENSVIYDISKREILCSVREKTSSLQSSLYWAFILKIWIHPESFFLYRYNNGHIFVSQLSPLLCWVVGFQDRMIYTTELQCTYDAVTIAEKDIELFDPYTGDSSKSPRYSYEYKTKTDEHISVVVTQTEYDGTVSQKTVDIRLIDDELKVEVQ